MFQPAIYLDSKHLIWLNPASCAPPYFRLPHPGHLPGQFTPMHPNKEQWIMLLCGGRSLLPWTQCIWKGKSFSDRPAQLSFHTVMIPCSHFSPELVSVKRTFSSQASQALRSDYSTQTDQSHIIQKVAPMSQRQTPQVSFSFSASPNVKDYRLSVTKQSLLPLIFQALFQCFPCVNSYKFQHNISMGNCYHYHGSFKSDETNEVDKWR